MSTIIEQSIWITGVVIGLFILYEGSKLISLGCVKIAQKSKYSRYVLGIFVVSTLAALPEVLITIFATNEFARGGVDLAIGSLLGSHVVNISFIVGIAAIIKPIKTPGDIIVRDGSFLVVTTLIGSVFIMDGQVSIIEGLVLLLIILPYLLTTVHTSKKSPDELKESIVKVELELSLLGQIFGEKITAKIKKYSLLTLSAGIIISVISAKIVTDSTLQISELFGIKSLILGVVFISVGASLPDIFAGYHAAKLGFPDLALGIGLGASLFTMLISLGIIGIVYHPFIEYSRYISTILIMNFVIFLVFGFMLTERNISRLEGVLLFTGYFVMVIGLFII